MLVDLETCTPRVGKGREVVQKLDRKKWGRENEFSMNTQERKNFGHRAIHLTGEIHSLWLCLTNTLSLEKRIFQN